MAKLNFLQCHMLLQKSCWFYAQETFIIIIFETVLKISGNCDMFQRTAFVTICCNIINIFTVTFDQFNAFLLNKSIRKKNLTKPKLLNGIYLLVFDKEIKTYNINQLKCIIEINTFILIKKYFNNFVHLGIFVIFLYLVPVFYK